MKNQLEVGISIANKVLADIDTTNKWVMEDLEKLRGYAYALNVDVNLCSDICEIIVENTKELKRRMEKLMW